MSNLDENKEVVDLVTKIWDLPNEERKKEALKMQVSTYLTVQSHDKKLEAMKTRMDSFPCQDNGILRFMAAMSTSKRIVVSIAGGLIIILTIIGATLGIVGCFKH